MKKLIKFITLGITCLLVVGTLYAAKMAVSEKTDVDDIFSRADISIFSNIRERTQTAAEHADKKSKETDTKKKNGQDEKKEAEIKPVVPEQVKVLLSNHGVYLQDTVSISCAGTYNVNVDGKKTISYKKNDVFDVAAFAEENTFDYITVEPETASDRIVLKNFEKSDGTPSYHGTIHIQKKEGYIVTNEIDLEEYLYAVVSSEMPSSYEKEALKAQAICARSYAVNRIRDHAYEKYGADLDDTTACQVYNNIFETPETIEAVQETAGEVLTCDGDMVQAYFFSTSCGTTCRNDDVWGGDKLSYLNDQLETYAETEAKLNSTPVMLDHGYFQIGDGRLSTEEVFRDFIDKKIYVNSIEKEEPMYRWSIDYSKEQMQSAVSQGLPQVAAGCLTFYDKEGNESDAITEFAGQEAEEILGTIKNIIITERGNSGIAQSMVIYGKQGAVKVDGQMAIRQVLYPFEVEIVKQDESRVSGWSLLPSAYFYIEKDKEGAYHLYGGGFGHGVGMSQNGANDLAKKGYKYEKILLHYFYGAEIKKINETGFVTDEKIQK